MEFYQGLRRGFRKAAAYLHLISPLGILPIDTRDVNYRDPNWKRKLLGVPEGQPTSDELWKHTIAGDPAAERRVVDLWIYIEQAWKAHEAGMPLPPLPKYLQGS